MTALIILGLLWALVLSFIGILRFFDAANPESGTMMVEMGKYAWLMSRAVWWLIASLPGWIMFFVGIVGKTLNDQLKQTKTDLEKIVGVAVRSIKEEPK